MTGSSRKIEISRVDIAKGIVVPDVVAVEEPLEIQVASSTAGGAAAKSVSITMRTPGNDPELALGFLFTEGIIRSMDQVVSVSHRGEPAPDSGAQNIVRVEIAPDVDLNLDRLERHFYTTSSCGVCGKASLDALRLTGLESLEEHDFAVSPETLLALPAAVRERQPIFAETGGLHAAALFGPDGEIGLVREDVGRHNATDKVIGALLEQGELPAHSMGLFVSGRASFELMQKSLVAGIPFLAAVGAPSSLAVDSAKEFGMTLVGFLRDDNFNIYAGAERIN
jgi:FdhD protein